MAPGSRHVCSAQAGGVGGGRDAALVAVFRVLIVGVVVVLAGHVRVAPLLCPRVALPLRAAPAVPPRAPRPAPSPAGGCWRLRSSTKR